MRERLFNALFSTPPRVAFARPWPGTRRGFKLWLLAVVVGLLGLNYLLSPIPATTAQALALPAELMPLSAWGYVIVGLCVVAMYTAYCHHGRDRIGYTILGGFALGWSVSYAVAPLFYDASGRAWSGALTWLVIFIFLRFSAEDEQ